MAEQQPSIYARMASIMAQISRMQKTGHNKFQNYDFATDADVLDELRGKLAEANIAFLPSMVRVEQEVGETKKGEPTTHTRCYFEFRFICGYTEKEIVAQWTGEATDNSDKGINKAATAAEKYFLMKTFMISTGNDPDAESPEAGKRAAQRSAQPPQQQKPPTAPPSPAKVTELAAPSVNTDSAVDWTKVWQKFSEMGWKPGDKNHIAEVFPGGVEGKSTGQLIAMIKPKPQYGNGVPKPVDKAASQ